MYVKPVIVLQNLCVFQPGNYYEHALFLFLKKTISSVTIVTLNGSIKVECPEIHGCELEAGLPIDVFFVSQHDSVWLTVVLIGSVCLLVLLLFRREEAPL
jgi:hypothetical protein